MKRVLIVGAGAQGYVVGTVLARAGDVQAVVLADLDAGRAAETAASIASDKVKIEAVDASDTAAVAALARRQRADLLINTSLPQFIPQVMAGALQAGTNYLDLSSVRLYDRDDLPIEQLAEADAWKASGRTALVNAGSAPGLTNIMAREAVDELDSVDAIRIRDYSADSGESAEPLWSLPTYLIDCAAEPTIWENGRPRRVPIYSGEEVCDFPEPLGVRGKVYMHSHEEPVTLPLFVGKPVRYCDYKLGDPGVDTWRFVVERLGLMSGEPMEINGAHVAPRDLLLRRLPRTIAPARLRALVEAGRISGRTMVMCEVTGQRDGREARVILWSDAPDLAEACRRIPGTSHVSLITSVPAATFSLMLLRDQIGHRGVVLPEMLGAAARELLYRGIGEWGIGVRKRLDCQAGASARPRSQPATIEVETGGAARAVGPITLDGEKISSHQGRRPGAAES